jgi:uncharacterized protein DUF4351
MPIDADIWEHELFKAARQEGRQEGAFTILRRLIEERFGALPGWAAEKLASLAAPELEDLSVRALDAQVSPSC